MQMPANLLRGIGRWASLYIRSLVTHAPHLVAAISIDDRLPIPPIVQQLPEHLPVLVSGEEPSPSGDGPLVFHAMSIFEDLALERIWPLWAQDPAVGLVVTLYDTIPALYPDEYFQGNLQYLLESRYQMLEHADAVIAISRATRQDAIRLLGIDQQRIVVTPVEVPDEFRPYPTGRASAHMLLPQRLGIEPDFILSIGNVDPRKNLPALIRAYACLPWRLRTRHQLVLTCSQAGPDHLASLRSEAVNLGVEDRLVLTSFIDDETMIRLYQACHTMVYPSFYEGLGLPVIEAMRCGACTLVSNTGALREAVHDPDAWFDPYDAGDIGGKLQRALDDSAFADDRRARGISDALHYSWDGTPPGVLEAYRLATLRP